MHAPELETGARAGWVDLLGRPDLAWIARRRELPIAAGLLLLAALAGLLFAGVWGTSVGNRNAAIVLVWILWWVLLMGVAVPVAGRGWCAVCPIPLPGEWLQRRALFSVRHAGKVMPRAMGSPESGTTSTRAPTAAGQREAVQPSGFRRRASCRWRPSAPCCSRDPFTRPRSRIGGLWPWRRSSPRIFRQRVLRTCARSAGSSGSTPSLLLAVRCRDDPALCRLPGQGLHCRQRARLGLPVDGATEPDDSRSNACGLVPRKCVRACPSDNMTVFLRPPLAEHPPRAGTRPPRPSSCCLSASPTAPSISAPGAT